MSKTGKWLDGRMSRVGASLVVATGILAVSLGAAVAQTAVRAQSVEQTQEAALRQALEQQQEAARLMMIEQQQNARRVAEQQQEAARRMAEEMAYVFPQSVWSAGSESSQLPQDIRIMQRIVTTALGEVEAPAVPDALRGDDDSADARDRVVAVRGPDAVLYVDGSHRLRIGGGDVTGFYMDGYGYLFTVRWPVAARGNAATYSIERARELESLVVEARRARATAEAAESRAAEEAELALQERQERVRAQQAALEQWSVQYRDRLAEALRDVVALYGSTLKRATPEESITFIADFGGGEAETVTVSARRGQLTGASREENLAAVQMATGETGVSDMFRTQLKIMAEIIDSSLQGESGNEFWVGSDFVRHFGGDSSYQYVPGYGVLFRKSARLNVATRVIQRANPARVASGATVEVPLRERIEESTEEQQQAYAEHLDDLKQRTAELFATYGPTLTEMAGDDWVGIYYNVGSGAGLLEGGISNFLVQARMGDIRGAGNQSDGAAWLLDRLVTNESQD